MRPLHRKLLRDLWQIRGQCFAIAAVIAVGVAMFLMYQSCYQSLRLTQEAYYDRYRFADVFAAAKRAPARLEDRIAEIPGVAQVETRVVAAVTLDIPGVADPAMAQLVSIPRVRRPILNDIAILTGRWVDPDAADEVVVSEGFALARELGPGDHIAAVINGRRRELEIVGVALSPEFIYTIRPGELVPDEGRYGIFWMGRKALATAFDMEGGFNDVALLLTATASADEVIARLDRLLEPWGGRGALPRELQISHWTLESELVGLANAAFIVPTVFLSVAAFLLNVVLNRIVAVQRSQIAALKALGYSRREIALHYVGWSLAIAVLGGALGIVAGAWMGANMIELYGDYYRFPFLEYRLPRGVLVGALAISFVAAVLGALGAVRKAASLPPAEAMRPEPPASYEESWLERLGLKVLLSPPNRMILRNVQRRPARTLSSIVGIAFAASLLVVGLFFVDAMDEMMDVAFNVVQRQDMTVSFVEPASARAIHEISRLPGVMTAETSRSVPVRLRHGHRSRLTSITGLAGEAELQRVVDASLRPVALPPEGLVLSVKLAEILGVERGDEVTVEVLEGSRPQRRAVVADLVREYLGTAVYMEAGALHRLLREDRNLSGAYLQVDARQALELYAQIKAMPAVAGVAVKAASLERFEEMMDQSIGLMMSFASLFASIIAFGVVYNAARISLSERSRELASLRVLGLHSELRFLIILLGELADRHPACRCLSDSSWRIGFAAWLH